MTSSEIRTKFLSFFKANGHEIVPSSPLIPAEDPTLLFTNAGMNQFKDLFLGRQKRSYTRATSMQKCVRAGGKHNDLDAVGFTPRHLTFFEMMGNFSFGDYFKKEAIELAWEFLIKEMGLPAEKLHASVYHDDDESYEIWKTVIGLPEERIVRCGQKDNFWAMGETGPCGPCSEIHFDRGEQYGCGTPECGVNCENCSRIMEVWNLVFMQYNRDADGTLTPLAQTGVDTGMGFERLCTIRQGKESVFQCDVFTPLIRACEELTGVKYAKAAPTVQAAFHVLVDHVRSTSLIIADGGSPANDGRGYVLRKITRRAALFAQKLSDDSKLFVNLAAAFIEHNGTIFPELRQNKERILSLLSTETSRFDANLVSGKAIFEKYRTEQHAAGSSQLTGFQVFKLYDTYGFPAELTRVLAGEHDMTLDMDGFERHMAKQKAQSGMKVDAASSELVIPDDVHTTFVGYESLQTTSPIQFVHHEDDAVWIVTQESPFYVESGGQVNDQGAVTIGGQVYRVIDLKKIGSPYNNPAIAVKIHSDSTEHAEAIKVGDVATSVVDSQARIDTVRNHTATHMLQAAMIQVLGPAVKQAGSVVEPDYLRFDYTCTQPPTAAELKKIEDLVNFHIQQNIQTEVLNTTLDDARKQGVIAFFGEKYNPESVRVVKIPGFSAELCGGTHAPATGIIGTFKITSDSSLSTGTRRIVAVTGRKALELFQTTHTLSKALSEHFKVKIDGVTDAVAKLSEQHQVALSQIKQLKKQSLKANIPAWAERIKQVGGVPFLYLELDDVAVDELKTICTQLEKIKPGVYFLVAQTPEAA